MQSCAHLACVCIHSGGCGTIFQMMIFVKSLTVSTITLDVDLSDSLATVCKKIQVRSCSQSPSLIHLDECLQLVSSHQVALSCRTESLCLANIGDWYMVANSWLTTKPCINVGSRKTPHCIWLGVCLVARVVLVHCSVGLEGLY